MKAFIILNVTFDKNPLLVREDGWIYRRSPDGLWVTIRQVTTDERFVFSLRAIPAPEALRYGFPDHLTYDSNVDIRLRRRTTDSQSSDEFDHVANIDKLRNLCRKLLEDLRARVPDRADSSLPEWEREAEKLGVIVL